MPRVPCRAFRTDRKTGILVIGAGISGALVAESLSADGHEVTIVDRRGPVRGSTPASTALVEYEIDTPLIELARKIGADKAARAWQRSRLAVDALAARTRALGISCEMTRRDSLYLAGNGLDREGLEREAEARRAAGLETLFLTGKALQERFGIRRAAALLACDDLVLDPRRLTAGYLKAAANRGTRIYAPVDVVAVEGGASGYVAETGDGPTISCRHLVFATGYEFPKFVPLKGHRVISTYAIATKPQRRRLWPEECLIWEASDPYLYMRTTPDGRIICGGEDEDFSDDEKRDALIPKKVAAIRRKLERLFPEVDTTPGFAWAGAFGASDTGLPLIGEVPRRPGCFAVLGFGGNGITYARVAADLIRAAIGGKQDPDTGLYAFA